MLKPESPFYIAIHHTLIPMGFFYKCQLLGIEALTILYNDHLRAVLSDSIGHCDQLFPAVLTMFSTEYIRSHSLSGKASNNTCQVKLTFDIRLFGLVVLMMFNGSWPTYDI